MNQGMYDLMMKELREHRETFERAMAEEQRFATELLSKGNGTYRDPSEHVSREFRDKV